MADDTHTAVGVVIGTLHYASPEQLRGDPVDARTDLYGLGCTLYTVLLNRRPFENEDQANLIRAHLGRMPVAPSTLEPTVPADLEQVILKLLAKRSEDRFPSASAVMEALARTEGGEGIALAGRKNTTDRMAAALDRVSLGKGTRVRVVGAPGTGVRWALQTLEDSARRRGVEVVLPGTPEEIGAARARLAQGVPLLLVTVGDAPDPDTDDIVVQLDPLGPGDVRRSVVANARGVRDPAMVAERLFRATGGLPALLVPCLRVLQADPQAFDGVHPGISVTSWIDPLDLDTLEILQALAVARQPLAPSVLEGITQVPAEQPVADLVQRGIARRIVSGDPAAPEVRIAIVAGLFSDEALSRIPDPESFSRRVMAAVMRPIAGPETDAWKVRFEAASARVWTTGASDGRALQELMAEASREHDASRVGRVALALGDLALVTRRPGEARSWYLEVHRQSSGDAGLEAAARHGEGVLLFLEAHNDDAAVALQDAAMIWRRLQEPGAEATTWLVLSTVLGLSGRLNRAWEAAERAMVLAQALQRPVLECATLQNLSVRVLDLRRPDEAGRLLADMTALAHAAGLVRERWISHVLRAQVSLETQGGSQNTAAAADRLMRVLGEKGLPDTGGWRAFGHALLARASAILGDSRSWQRAQACATEALLASTPHTGLPGVWGPPALPLPIPEPPLALWTRIELARAAWVAGQRDVAAEHLRNARASARERSFATLDWQIGWLEARMARQPLPPPGDLAEGLASDVRRGLEQGLAFP